MAIKHIIFDLGEVLINTHPEKFLSKLPSKTRLDLNSERGIYLSDIHLQLMEGKISFREFYEILKSQLNFQIPFEEFKEYWTLVIGEAKFNVHNLLEKLAGKYILSICSNTDTFHWEIVKYKFNFWEYFDHLFLSFDIGSIKPHPAIYSWVIDQGGVEARECIFLDDSEKNVHAARLSGMQAIKVEQGSDIPSELFLALQKII